MPLTPNFFAQCRATSVQTALIAEFEQTAKELLEFHAAQAGSMTPVWPRARHHTMAARLAALLGKEG